MAKRELSSTLKNLKFMQRAAHKEEKAKKEEEVKSEWNFTSPDTVKRKCVVVMEGDPHPGAVIGRMSFQSFNPSIDKLNEAAASTHQPEASATCFSSQIGRNALRENGSLEDGAECSKADKCDANGDLKRKQSEADPDQQYPNKSSKHVQAGKQALPSYHKSSHKQVKREKLDWSVLRPPK